MVLSGALSKQNQIISGTITKQNGTLSGVISRVSDHTVLTGREKPNQHPIEAITGLSDYIDALNNGFILYCGSATEVI
jgi:hypothetical protein